MKATPAVAAVALIVAGITAGCEIATVRRLDDQGARPEAAAGTARPFDAAAVVTAAWNAELLPAIASARDVNGLAADEAVFQPVVVHGRGRVVDANVRSRAGTATLDVDGGARFVVQIGPVLTGTAIRDALPSLGFDRFINQLQHADVGNELNARVEQQVLQGLDRTKLRGAYLSFTGMARREEGGLVKVTPVRLERQEQP